MKKILPVDLSYKEVPIHSPSLPLWALRLVTWIRGKLEPYDLAVTVRVTQYHVRDEINDGPILQQALEQYWMAMDYGGRKEPKTFIIGANEYNQLENEAVDTSLDFDATFAIHNNERRFRDMRIVIVPWMSGMVCIPQEVSGKDK